MAATKTALVKFPPYGIQCIATDGTYIYTASRGGYLRKVAISGLAVTDLVKFDKEIVKMVAYSTTYLYLFFRDGTIERYTIADTTHAVLGTAPGLSLMGDDITDVLISSTTMYISCGNGQLYSMTIA